MGFEAVKAVYTHSTVRGTERYVLVTLAYHADENMVCWPSQELLAKETGLTMRTIAACVKNLEKAGEVEVKRGNGRGIYTTYKITVGQKKTSQISTFSADVFVDETQEPSERLKSTVPFSPEERLKSTTKRVKSTDKRLKSTQQKAEIHGSPYKEESPEESPMESPKEPQGAIAQNIQRVFSHWQSVLDHPMSKLDDKRRKLIKQRFLDGYNVTDLCRAIDGCKASDWHQGQNDKGQVYDSIELIFRDAGKVDQFIGYLSKQARPVPVNGNGNGHHRSNGYDPAAVQAEAIRKFEAIHGSGSAGPVSTPVPAPADFVEGEILDDTF